MGFLESLKITPNDFVRNQLDNIFSSNFVEAEKLSLASLSKDNTILQKVSADKYIIERQNVIYNLLQLAWDRTVSYAICTKYAFIMSFDPRVKAVDSGAYDSSLSRAQEAGMGIFRFIAMVFVAQINSQDVDLNDTSILKLMEIYMADFTNRYISFVALIKQHKLAE
jgi:hypothetical protein